MRRRRVRGLHRLSRRAAGELVPRTHLSGSWAPGRDRGIASRRSSRPVARARRDPMRCLHARRRDDRVLDHRSPRPARVPHRPGAAGRQPVPLHRLRRHCRWHRRRPAGSTVKLLQPSSLTDALAILAGEPGVVPMAGGTDLLVHWPTRPPEHDKTYLDLSALAELGGVRWSESERQLGALATSWDVIADGRAAQELPLLVQAARLVGAIQILTRGTWGGNIVNASPAADGVPVLMAYDARVVLESVRGREEVPLAEFYTGYKQMRKAGDQLVVAIRVPRREYTMQQFH